MAEAITQALVAAMMQCEAPMVLTDPHASDHPMIAVNPAFEAVTQYDARDSVGRNCRFLQGADTDAASVERIRRCIETRRGCVEWLVNYRADGTMFWNLLFITPVFSPDGRLLHFFGNQRDITKGHSSTLPDYALGKADMPEAGVIRFNALLSEVLTGGEPGAELDRLVDAARRLDFLTVRLKSAAWEMPPAM